MADGTTREAQFCHRCGRRYVSRYPGCYLPEDPPEYLKREAHLPPDERVYAPENASPMGDPESGPRCMRCPAGHPTVDEEIEIALESSGRVDPEEFLGQYENGERWDPIAPEIPLDVRAAARTLILWRMHESTLTQMRYEEQFGPGWSEEIAQEDQQQETPERSDADRELSGLLEEHANAQAAAFQDPAGWEEVKAPPASDPLWALGAVFFPEDDDEE